MAGQVITISFSARQAAIPGCGIVNLKYSAGDLRAEYLSGSELHKEAGSWSYQFLIQEEDLPGSLTLEEATQCNLVEPFWSCLADDEAEEEENECEVRNISCFDALQVIETLGPSDYVPVLQHNEECDTYCLGMMDPYDFFEQIKAPIE